jgi:hypothetical protein
VGRTSHDHPSTLHQGIIYVRFADTEWYYLYYTLLAEDSEEYVELEALPQCTTNPNGGRIYESDRFVEYVRKYDPWLIFE